MDGTAALWPEQMAKCMVIEEKQTNKKTKKQQIRTRKIHQ